MTELDGRTTMVGLIGWPVGHSVSPRMHNAAFDALGLDWCYIPLPVSPVPEGRIGDAVTGLQALGFRGANVTIPHKQTVIPFLDEVTDAAQAIGAVNTIIIDENGVMRGDNTDARGFIADLSEHGMNPDGRRALVLGAGGSARAVVFGIAEAGAQYIAIVNRTALRAHELAETMKSYFPSCDIVAPTTVDAASVPLYDLVVNCTSVGMEPDVDSMPWQESMPFHNGQLVYDLVYNPSPTRLARYAHTHNAQAVNGKGMLVWQGAIAFELWTGEPAPVETMKDVIGIS